VILKKRTTVSGEKHRLLGSGFIERSDQILVFDLDFDHAPETMSRFAWETLVRGGKVFIPKFLPCDVPAHSWTEGELACALENYLACQVIGMYPQTQDGYPTVNFQIGMHGFRLDAVCELFKRHWIFDGSFWDLEVAIFSLQADLIVTYLELEAKLRRPDFDVKEARLKLEALFKLPSSLSFQQLADYFDAFHKRYSRLIRSEVIDRYRDQVLNPVIRRR
jgi:hypothetical protein